MFERYGKLVPFQLADSELRLDATSEELTLLQVQSDHERQLANISSSATRAEIDDEYHGPAMI